MSFNEWKEFKISDLIEIIGGGTPKTSIPEYWSGSIPWLSVKDFNTGYRYVYETEKTITEIGLNNSSTKLLKKDDLIISARGTVGALAQLGRPMAFNQSCYGLRAKEMTTNDFVYYLLKNMIGNIQQNTHGSVFNTITRDTFGILKANLPPLEEQKAIAHILSTLDDKIEVNNQINKTLENMTQTIFKQWFVDFEFPNEDGEPYKSSGGEMIESELGMIPKGWEVKTILDMDLIVTDYVANGSFKALKENVTLYEEHNYAIFMRNTDLKCNFNSGMKYVDRHSYDFLKKSRLYGGEVIISNVGDVGSVYLCPYFDQPMTLGNNVIMVKAEKNPTWNYFVYRLFNSREGQGMIDSITGGSAQPKFNKTDFRNLKVVIPSEMFINSYMKTLSSIEDCILLNDKQNSELIKIRDSLLPKLMSGEIRVPLDSDGDVS